MKLLNLSPSLAKAAKGAGAIGLHVAIALLYSAGKLDLQTALAMAGFGALSGNVVSTRR